MKCKQNADQLYSQYGNKMCLAPFVQAFYSSNGINFSSNTASNHIRPCSVIKPDSRWNITEDSIKRSINNSLWQEVRQHFLQGDLHPLCATCLNAENNGASSPRILANEYLFEHFEVEHIMTMMKSIVDHDLTTDKLLTMDWMPSNYCNYACVMCFSGASSQRYAYEIKKGQHKARYFVNEPNSDFFDMIKDVEILGFTGGETILQPEVLRLIDWLVDNNLSQKIIITILTNASEFPDDLIAKFRQFKKVLYTVSIDGVGPVIEYQRRGADWNNVCANAVKIINTPELHAIVNHVVTGINILSAMDFIDWCKNNDIKHIAISQVYQSYLGVATLPPELRKLAWSRLVEGRRRYQHLATAIGYEKNWLDCIDRLISIIETTKHNTADLQRFVEHITQENTESHRPMHEVVPEWAPWFS